jgi:hypothetical protein
LPFLWGAVIASVGMAIWWYVGKLLYEAGLWPKYAYTPAIVFMLTVNGLHYYLDLLDFTVRLSEHIYDEKVMKFSVILCLGIFAGKNLVDPAFTFPIPNPKGKWERWSLTLITLTPWYALLAQGSVRMNVLWLYWAVIILTILVIILKTVLPGRKRKNPYSD